MAFNWDVKAEDEVTVAFSDPNYSDFSTYDFFRPALDGNQSSQFIDPSFLSWSDATYLSTTPDDVASEANTTSQLGIPCLSSATPGEDPSQNEIPGLEERLKSWEERMERRLAEIEERMRNIQTGLEDEKTKFCSEIKEHIGQLRGWAAEVQGIFGRVTEYKK